MRRISEKQSLYSKYMFTSGSESFGNGVKSARKAGYKGNDNILRAIASQNLTKLNIRAEKQRIQAETNKSFKHNRDIAINKLYTDYDYLETGAKAGNIQAIQARTAIVRELSAISNLHSQTINNQGDGLKIVVQERVKPILSKEIA